MKRRKLTEEQFERKGLMIMSMIGIIIILIISAYNLYQNHFKNNDIEFDSKNIILSAGVDYNDYNRTCFCSSKCFMEYCYVGYDERFDGDSFMINNNLTQDNCNICGELRE